MHPKTESRKSILVIPSRIVRKPDEAEGGEETEITAQVSMPNDGGWGWVVVFAAFVSIGILDGVIYTFGSLHHDITADLHSDEASVALINSVAVCLYQATGPIVSAFINRFGFRACIMAGSVITSFSLFISYFAPDYTVLFIFYGVFAGCGSALVNMCCSLVVGFYFEKYRSIALAIAVCGSSLGVTAFYPLNSYLVSLAGWRSTTLFHSGLMGIIFFLGMTFRPLVALTVVRTSDTTTDPTRTVAYLPSLAAVSSRAGQDSRTRIEGMKPTATERLFSAVSNAQFPTAAAVVKEETTTTDASSPSKPGTSGISKITLATQRGELTEKQLKQVQSIISARDSNRQFEEVIQPTQPVKKRGFWARLFHWPAHVSEARPLYRDDAFYEGKLKDLPAYQRSKVDARQATEPETGLEYQLAVSRAVAVTDLRERRGVFTTAVRRVLATMMDPKLLKRCSFLLLCFSSIFMYLGYLVPYVFLESRNKESGIDPKFCNIMMSTLGACNTVGRLALGFMASKLDSLKIYWICFVMSGSLTALSNVSHNVYFQFAYSGLFGFCIACVSCLRSVVLVNLYGLDKLTNATGMILLFQGIGSLFSTPLAGALKEKYGYSTAFYVSGTCIILGGILLIPLKCIVAKETASLSNKPADGNKNITVHK